MSINVLPVANDLWGRVGSGLGKGLAEQVPKEIERYRLSSGLKNLSKQDLSGKNRLEILGEIANIPGITPELSQQAFQQIQAQNYFGRNKENKESNSSEKIPKETISRNLSEGFAPKSEVARYKNSILQQPSLNEIDSLAEQYFEKGVTKDLNEARSFAKEELSQNLQAQQSKINKFREDASKRFGLTLQNQGIGSFEKLAGEIQQELIDQGEILIDSGVSPEEASNQMNKIALKLGKEYNSLKESGSFWNQFRGSSTKDTEIKQQRKEFEKYGFGHLFDQLAVAETGRTPLSIANTTDPLKNNKVKEIIRNGKNNISRFGTAKANEKFFDEIIKNMTQKDNLYSIEYLLRKNQFSVNAFKKRLLDKEADGDIVLSDRQQEQQSTPISEDFLGDILHEVF